MVASIIIAAGKQYGDQLLQEIKRYHQKQLPTSEIIVSQSNSTKFNLSQVWNLGASKSIADKLFFVHVDTVFYDRAYQDMLDLNKNAIRGIRRCDVKTINGQYINDYECTISPLFVTKELFLSVGGFCEDYEYWCYEDSDFLFKIDQCEKFDAKARHIMDWHNVKIGDPWVASPHANKELYQKRVALGRQKIIEVDIIRYKSQYGQI